MKKRFTMTSETKLQKQKIKHLSKAEVDIIMCRLQGAVYENDKERINKILKEIRKRVKELKENKMWFGK